MKEVFLFGDYEQFRPGMNLNIPPAGLPKSLLEALRGGGQIALHVSVSDKVNAEGKFDLVVIDTITATDLLYEFACRCLERALPLADGFEGIYRVRPEITAALKLRRLCLKGEYPEFFLQSWATELEKSTYKSPIHYGFSGGVRTSECWGQYNCVQSLESAAARLANSMTAPAFVASGVRYCVESAVASAAIARRWSTQRDAVISHTEEDDLICDGYNRYEVQAYANSKHKVGAEINEGKIRADVSAVETKWQEAALRELLNNVAISESARLTRLQILAANSSKEI